MDLGDALVQLLLPPSPDPVTRDKDTLIHHTRTSQFLQINNNTSTHNNNTSKQFLMIPTLDPLFHRLLFSLLISANTPIHTKRRRHMHNPPPPMFQGLSLRPLYPPTPPLAHKPYSGVMYLSPPPHIARESPSHIQQ